MVEYGAALASSVSLGQWAALDAKIEWMCPDTGSWVTNQESGNCEDWNGCTHY